MMKATWTPWLALFGFVLGVANAVFSSYQWWNSQYQSRVTAAIELSKTYLQDIAFSRRLRLFVDTTQKGTGNHGDDEFRERSYVDFLDYVSRLANEGLIENQY